MEYEVQARNLPDEPMLRAYLEAAEWVGLMDEQREAFEDADWIEWTPESIERAREDCEAFLRDNAEDIGMHLARAGMDFYLTRNHHGAGFWDGDWPSDVGARLTKAAHVYGSTFEDFDPATGMLETR